MRPVPAHKLIRLAGKNGMPELSKDAIALLQYLAPGFLVAWVYFGLTSHAKPSEFERLVQALIYTVVIQAMVVLEMQVAVLIGMWHSLGTWTIQSDLIAGLTSAIVLGFAMATAANHDTLHAALRRIRITKRTGHPCEWFSIFSEHPRFVSLRLKDASKVYGWPKVWPADAEKGHFFVTRAVRTVGGIEESLTHLEGVLVNVSDVAYVDFIATQESPND